MKHIHFSIINKVKYIFALFLTINLLNFIGCTWESPSDFSIKSKATYNYTIGNFERNLSDNFSKDTLEEKLNDNDDKFKIYDYNPAGNAKSKQFLIEYPVQEIPIDLGSYFAKMDFVDKLNKKNIDKEISVPDIKTDENVTKIDAPDVNEIICKKSKFGNKRFTLPASGTITADDIPKLDIDFTSPNFETLSFCAGSLDVTATSDGDDIPTNLTVTLYKTDGTEITKVTGVDLSHDPVIKLPLANKTIYHDMKLGITGSATGSGSGTVDYNVKTEFDKSIKVTRATGLTMGESELGDDGKTDINEKVPLDLGDEFISCVVGDDGANKSTMTIKSTSMPSTWSGVKCKKNIALSGALNAADSEFDKTHETDNNILDRTLPLNGHTIFNGDINITGSVSVEFENATIVTENGVIDPIEITTTTDIKAFKSVTVDLGGENGFDPTPTTTTENFPSDAARYLKKIKMMPSGVDVKYTNNLPAGNDITMVTSSNFFGINNSQIKMTSGGPNATEQLSEVRGTQKTLTPEFPDIDFTVGVELPGATADSPTITTLKNLKIGEKYKIAIEVTPYIDYEYVVLDSNNVATSSGDNPINTGLNFNEMFSGLLDILNQSEDFTQRLDLQRLPIFLYAVIPDLTPSNDTDETLLDRLTFKGKFIANLSGSTSGEPIYVVGSNSEDGEVETAKTMPPLAMDKNDIFVITDISNSGVTGHDVADLFNRHEDGKVIMTYNFTMKDKNGSEDGITIYKEDIDNYKNENGEDDVHIALNARIILPMELRVMPKEEGNTEPLMFELSNLIYPNSNSDLLGRDGATDTSDFDKYIDAAKTAGARYKLTNNFLKYSDGNTITAIMDANSSDAAHPITSIGNNGKLSVDCEKNDSVAITIGAVRDILNCECFHPLLSAALPLGNCYIPLDGYMNVQFNIFVKTDGTVNL